MRAWVRGDGRTCSIRHTVPLAMGTCECNGAVKNEDGTRSGGYKLVTWRTLLVSAGLLTQVLWQPSGFTKWLCAVPVGAHIAMACGRLACGRSWLFGYEGALEECQERDEQTELKDTYWAIN